MDFFFLFFLYSILQFTFNVIFYFLHDSLLTVSPNYSFFLYSNPLIPVSHCTFSGASECCFAMIFTHIHCHARVTGYRNHYSNHYSNYPTLTGCSNSHSHIYLDYFNQPSTSHQGVPQQFLWILYTAAISCVCSILTALMTVLCDRCSSVFSTLSLFMTSQQQLT